MQMPGSEMIVPEHQWILDEYYKNHASCKIGSWLFSVYSGYTELLCQDAEWLGTKDKNPDSPLPGLQRFRAPNKVLSDTPSAEREASGSPLKGGTL